MDRIPFAVLRGVSVDRLQELLLLERLEWLHACSWDELERADAARARGMQLVAEHLRRGLDPDTGQPLGRAG